jgi:hypothetical protein
MQTQTSINEGFAEKQTAVKIVLDAWQLHNKRFDKLFDELEEAQLLKETAPGRNSGIYLAGHLVAVSDGMLPILGFGEKLYPQLENIFIRNADKAGIEMPSIAELKKYQDDINAQLFTHINQLTPEEWFGKHNSVSEEDFEKEPHRNKLNIIVNRTNHLSYHLGQLAYLVNKD